MTTTDEPTPDAEATPKPPGTPDATGAPVPRPRRTLLARLGRALAVAALVTALLLVATYFAVTVPVDRSPILGTAVAKQTWRAIDRAAGELRQRGAARGALWVGWGRADITPPVSTPTLGYGARLGRAAGGKDDDLFAHALALRVGDARPVVLVSADICLWPPDLHARVEKALAGRVRPDQLYYGATHTHNGPGAIAKSPLFELLFGAVDEAVVGRLVRGIAAAVEGALSGLGPGGYREHWFNAPEAIEDRTRHDAPIDPNVYVLEVKRSDGLRFALVSFGAHPTSISHRYRHLSGDYPGALVRSLRERGFADAMFLAGATGQAGPRYQGQTAYHDGTEVAYALGEHLAKRVAEITGATPRPYRKRTILSSVRARVTLPPWRKKLLGRMLRPRVASWLIDAPTAEAHVHGLRLGDTVLCGHSFELSSIRSRVLKGSWGRRGVHLVLTGFNGADNFYVVPEAAYDQPGYEGGMTVFGPGLAPYVDEITDRVVRALMPGVGQARDVGQTPNVR